MPSFFPETSDAPVLVLFLNADHTVGYINDQGCQMIGYARHEVIGRRWIEQFVEHENLGAIQHFYDQIMSGAVGLLEQFENHIRTKNGSLKLFSWHSKLVRNGQGQIIGMITFGEDYTDRKTLLKALNKQEHAGRQQVKQVGENGRFTRREDIAFELHDNINQVLTTCKLLLGQELAANPQLPLVQKSSNLLSKVIDDIRNLSHHLNALPVQFTDFEHSLSGFLEGVKLASGLHFEIAINDNDLLNLVPPHVLSGIHRVVQEHMSTIIRHGLATRVWLKIAADSRQISLSIEDDGQGFDLSANSLSPGYKSIQHRIHLNRGTLRFGISSSGGCVLTVNFPLG
ncbi:PAS domain S-box-containing protein [Cnuella takakiae]|uniref:histidine kinase n=1 Tax=Cnuella takakiae TaxID=1302690 RepID=A0A1M4ZAI1_9BACT|nr:PAS domain S-box protein [Cnuella takakiae]OLY94287.1 hypothetical protein BUE76_22155 [Cnuella takakiae]SHF14576.1 PAS domain S-box-containing protein [Cnuella takakiae]